MKNSYNVHNWIVQAFKIVSSKKKRLYAENYAYREGPMPRPISNVSLGEIFGWFFKGDEFLSNNPHVNDVAYKCRTDPTYSGERPQRLPWSSEKETGSAIYSIIRLVQPKNVIEIGIYNGATSICIAQALYENKSNGCLHCIELDEYNINLTEQHLEEAGFSNLVKFHHGSSH